jgi:hypothetical protein
MDGWEADGRQTSALLRGIALEQAVRWMDTRPSADLWPDERAFVEASLDHATRAGSSTDRMNRPAQVASSSVFVCYRRRDTQDEAVALARYLRRELGSDVFLDLDIAPGEDFQKVIARRMQRSSLVLVLIGPDWLDAVGQRTHTYDFVHSEVALALRANVRVVPVLVRGAPMPREDQLPDALKPLARRQAFVLDLGYNAEAQLAAVAGLVRHTSVGPDESTTATRLVPWLRNLVDQIRSLLRGS